MKFKILFLIPSLFFLTGCPQDLPNVQGRYQGWLLDQRGRTQVVCEVPSFTDNQQLEFKLFETKASDPGQNISIRVRKDHLYLNSQLIGGNEVKLNLDGACASNESIKVCLNGNEIHLEVKDQDSQNLILALDLAKNDSLPPLVVEETGIPHVYTLDEIMGRSRFYNFETQKETYRARVARKNIDLAAKNLIPHVHMKGLLLTAFEGPVGLLEMAGDLLPFIFPSNWYKKEEAKQLYEAQKKSLAMLRGNEMNSAQNLYYLAHQNFMLLKLISKHLELREGVHGAIQVLEKNQVLPLGSSDEFKLSILPLVEDKIILNRLLTEELAELSHAVAIAPSHGIQELAPLAFPNLSEVSPLDARDYFLKAKSQSLELATLYDLLQASRGATDIKKYEWWDPSSEASIGITTPIEIEISIEKTGEIQKMIEETNSIIESRVIQVVGEQRETLESFNNTETSLEIAKQKRERLTFELLNGDSLALEKLIDVNDQILLYENKRLVSIYAYLMVQGKLDRLLKTGFYANL